MSQCSVQHAAIKAIELEKLVECIFFVELSDDLFQGKPFGGRQAMADETPLRALTEIEDGADVLLAQMQTGHR
jgi:hypothetical protein